MEHCFKIVQPKKVRQVLEKSTQSAVRSLHGLRFGVTPLELKRSFHHSTSLCSSVDILGISVVDRNVCLATRLRSIFCQSISVTPFQYSLIHFTQAVRFYVWEKSQNVQNDGLKNHSGMKYPLN